MITSDRLGRLDSLSPRHAASNCTLAAVRGDAPPLRRKQSPAGEPPDRVLDKLAHITQLTAEIRQLVGKQTPDEFRAIEATLAPIEDRVHRLSKQLSQVPLGTLRQ